MGQHEQAMNKFSCLDVEHIGSGYNCGCHWVCCSMAHQGIATDVLFLSPQYVFDS